MQEKNIEIRDLDEVTTQEEIRERLAQHLGVGVETLKDSAGERRQRL